MTGCYSRASDAGKLRITAGKLFPADDWLIASSTSRGRTLISVSSSLRSLEILKFAGMTRAEDLLDADGFRIAKQGQMTIMSDF